MREKFNASPTREYNRTTDSVFLPAKLHPSNPILLLKDISCLDSAGDLLPDWHIE